VVPRGCGTLDLVTRAPQGEASFAYLDRRQDLITHVSQIRDRHVGSGGGSSLLRQAKAADRQLMERASSPVDIGGVRIRRHGLLRDHFLVLVDRTADGPPEEAPAGVDEKWFIGGVFDVSTWSMSLRAALAGVRTVADR
jgi:hypothetical protein